MQAIVQLLLYTDYNIIGLNVLWNFVLKVIVTLHTCFKCVEILSGVNPVLHVLQFCKIAV